MGAAARQIGITQGAVSQRIARLEARLGCPLFSRSPEGLRLTPKGEPLAEAVESALEQLVHALTELHPESAQTVRINCTPSLASEWLVPALEDFYAKHPDLSLVIYADQEAITPGRMGDEGIDIAIRYAPEAVAGFIELACVQEYVAPVRAPGARAATTTVRLHDETPWVVADRDAEWRAWEAGGDCAFPSERDQRFNLASLAYDAAASGQGVAMGRLVLVSRRLRQGQLVAADARIAPGAAYRILARTAPGRRSAAMQFARWMADHLAEAQTAARDAVQQTYAA